MTISSTANRISYAGNGSTTAFSFPYLFFADDDLKVVLVVDATGVETTKLLTTHYTVAGETVAAGGTVTMGTAPASGETLVIIRQEQFTQGLDLVENDPFPSDNVEQQFDILTMLSQQLNDEVSRSFKLSDGDTSGANLTVATPTADQLVGWDNAGLTLENKDPADITNMSIYYLGPYASNPTTNNAGGVLVEGNIYFDTANDYFKVYDGSAWVVGLSARTWSTFTYTAAGAETSVSGADDDAATLAYTAGQIRVFLNGVLLDDADYTATTGTSITGLAALSASDILFVEAYDNVAALGTMADQNASAVAITGGTITGTTGAAQTITALTTSTINGVNAATAQYTTAEETKLSGIEALANVTDATNVTAAGALMDSELTSLADVKAIDQGLAQADSPTFAGAGFGGTVTGTSIDISGDLNVGQSLILDGATTYAGNDITHLYSQAANGLVIATGAGSTNDLLVANKNGTTVLSVATGTTTAAFAGSVTAASATVDYISLDDKALTITGDTSDTFTITTGAAGATTLATTDAAGTDGHLTLDVDGQIILDAGDASGATLFKSSGTHYGTLYNSGSNLYLESEVSDGNIIFKGNDGGVSVTPLLLDMSDAGKAYFYAGAIIDGGDVTFADNAKAIFGAGDDLKIYHDGTNNYIQTNGGGPIRLNDSTAGDMIHAESTGVRLYHAGATKLTTTGTGATVTGGIVADSATIDDISLDGKVLTITGDTGDTFTITSGTNGATTLATTDAAGTSGSLILDADGGIILDAGSAGGPTILKTSGTRYGTFVNGGNDFYLRSDISDGDMILQGYDGGSTVNALTLDMSDAGAAYFNYGVNTSWLNDNYFRMYYSADYHMGMHMEGDTRDLVLYTKSADNAGDIRFKTGSAPTERMTILADGNVGIGTATPVAKLQIDTELNAMSGTNVDVSNISQKIYNPQNDDGEAVGIGFALSTVDTNVGAAITHERTAQNSKGKLHFATKGDVNAATDIPIRMTIDADGNLGIGTTAPSQNLHVASTGDAILFLEADTDNDDETHNPKIMFSQDGGAATARVGYTSGLNTFEVFNEYGDALLFGTNNTERMRIKNAGNVGIGTTDPSSTLEVVGDLTVDDINLDGKVLTITGDTGDTFKITAGTNGATTLATVDTAAAAANLTVDVDGYVVLDAGDASGSFFLKNSGTTYGTIFNSGNDFYIKSFISDGDFKIQGVDGASAVTAVTFDMSEAGTATFNNDVNPAVTETQDLGSATFEWDNIFVQNAVTVSDARKKNIVGGITWGTDLLRAMGPKVYTLKDTVIPAHNVINADGEEQEIPEMTISHERPHTGFVAQEVKAAMDSIGLDDWAGYAYDDDNDTHALRLMEMTGVLVQGWKDLDARIAALEAA